MQWPMINDQWSISEEVGWAESELTAEAQERKGYAEISVVAHGLVY